MDQQIAGPAVTSRERFLNVINGRMPDRVPVTLFICDGGHFLNQLCPNIDRWDWESAQRKVIEIQRQFGVDVFVRQLYGVNDPLFIHMGGLNVQVQTDNWEVRTEIVHHGNTRIERSEIRTPAGKLTQDFSTTEVRPGTFVFACTKKPIGAEAELDIAVRYEPRMPACWKEQVKHRVKIIRDALGEDGILGTWTPHGPFNNASLLIDHDQLYSLFRVDWRFYEKLMHFAMERILDYTRAIDEAGPDVHCVGGNVPGGFLGRRNYDQYVLPFEKRYIEFVQQSGVPAMYHNCGEIMNLVESYKELGARMVEPFSPPPLGDADLARAKQRVGGAYIMLSGIDQVNVLQNGAPEDVKRATEKALLDGKPGGGFILQPVDFLEYGTPEANVRAYVDTAMQHAAY
jgi:uroporphyrinogen-III decarboxylase